jgi:hypothetical protein
LGRSATEKKTYDARIHEYQTVTMGKGTVCLQKVINHCLDTKAVSVSLSDTEFYKK